jgi:hypothetical protein
MEVYFCGQRNRYGRNLRRTVYLSAIVLVSVKVFLTINNGRKLNWYSIFISRNENAQPFQTIFLKLFIAQIYYGEFAMPIYRKTFQ